MTQVPTGSTSTKPVFDPAAFANKAQEVDPIKSVRNSSSVMANNPYVQHMVRSLETKKALAMPVQADTVRVFVSWLRDAARKNDNGLRVQYVVGNGEPFTDPAKLPDKGSVTVKYQATAKKGGEKQQVACPVCSRDVSVTMEGKIRKHGKRGETPCAGSDQTPAAPAPSEPSPAA